MATATHSAGFGTVFAASLRHAVEDFKAYRATRKEYTQIVHELSSLDDRELTDLGISRYNINAIARTHVYGA